MPSSGQLSGYEERGADFSRNTRGGHLREVEYKNKRTNVVRLLPNGFQERKLRKLANTSARLFDEVNYERRQQFFQQHRVDFKSTWDKYYEKYKGILGVNVQAILQKNNEAWSSFFSLLNLKKKGKLPQHMNHVSPPRYWKKEKKRKSILVVRQEESMKPKKNITERRGGYSRN
jgi:transposase